MKLLAFCELLTVALLIGTGCEREHRTIEFIFPDGFNGLILISEDAANGASLPLVNDKYTIQVPESGKVSLKNLNAFARWHNRTAKFKNGKSMHIGIVGIGESEVGLSGLAFTAGKGIYMFVGTSNATEVVAKTFDYSGLPLGTNTTGPK